MLLRLLEQYGLLVAGFGCGWLACALLAARHDDGAGPPDDRTMDRGVEVVRSACSSRPSPRTGTVHGTAIPEPVSRLLH